MMLIGLVSLGLASLPASFEPAEARPIAGSQDLLCNPGPPAFAEAWRLSDKMVLYLVTQVDVEADPLPDDELDLVRGTYELTPLATLKGGGPGERKAFRFDATLQPDLFGGPPCRWAFLPVRGAIWMATGSRDGEVCAECDTRLDATHQLGWLGPLASFAR